MNLKILTGTLVVMVIASYASLPGAQGINPGKPSKTDKCPVCGMFVYKYPDYLAQVIYRNGPAVYFDGAKDMFKFLLAPGRDRSEVAALYVTEYYRLTPIDARKAHFVTGSDVYGPMGKELIPFETRKDAEEFLRDHRGKNIFTFDEITMSILKGLD